MTWLFVALLVLVGEAGAAQTASVEEQRAVSLAQRTAVNTLDRTLTTKQSVASWVRHVVGPGTPVQGEVNDCGGATGSSADLTRDLPVCVQAIASLADKREVSVSVAVGTQKKGMFRPAQYFDAYVVNEMPNDRARSNPIGTQTWSAPRRFRRREASEKPQRRGTVLGTVRSRPPAASNDFTEMNTAAREPATLR